MSYSSIIINGFEYHLIPLGQCMCGCGGIPAGGRYLRGHSNWKGGRRPQKGGYVRIHSPNHPRKDVDGYVKEHILIAEKALGKPLPPKAVVHHHSPLQLVVCENQAYHLFLHQRERAYKSCGHAHWRKCGFCKKYDMMSNLMISGKQILHDKCYRLQNKQNWANKRK